MKSLILLLAVFLSIVHCQTAYDSRETPIHSDFAMFNGYRLLAFNETFQRWYTESEAEALAYACGHHVCGFMDITDHQDLKPQDLTITAAPIPDAPHHQDYVNRLLEKIEPQQIKKYVDMLTSFHTRFYTTDDGFEAARTIYRTFKEIAAASRRSDIEIGLFEHNWKQPSIFARIRGRELADEIVILSSHEDSISNSSSGRAPGADDNASGTASVLEIFRVLALSGFKPSRTIEFHTYSAEEVGLRGSQDVASLYQSNNKTVHGVLHLDMTMFQRDPNNLVLIIDYVSIELTSFVSKLVSAYTNRTPAYSICGYGCSDHASWTKAGYRSAYPSEASFGQKNPYIHTDNDLFDHLSLEQGVQFGRLALGFLVELSY